MARTSAGILLYRVAGGRLEVLLVHPGGPYWKHKDGGAWTIPKGEHGPDEDAEATARREFREETGFEIDGELLALTPLKQRGGKVVAAWAVEGDCEPSRLESNRFTMEWPPGSGKTEEFPEVDRAGWFTVDQALEKILPGQRGFLIELGRKVVGR